MSKKHKTTIRREITNLAITAVGLALLTTFVFSASYTIYSKKQAAILELETMAKITALNSQSALLFRDRKISQETIDSVAPHREIVEAEIVTLDGEVLARRVFLRHENTAMSNMGIGGLVAGSTAFLFGKEAFIRVEQPVRINGKPLGTVKLKADLTPLLMLIIYSLAVFMGAMVLAFILSWFMIRKMLVNIMLPIERLGNSAKNIAVSRRYSLRVERLTDDELGILTDQFNLMLDEVEKRDKELSDKNDFLELAVENRTQAMRKAMEETHSLLNSMAEGAFGVDVEGNCRFVNQSFLRILGFERAEEVIGTFIHDLIQPTHVDGKPYPALESKIYDAYRLNQGFQVSDEIFWRKDGVAIPVEYWSQPLVVEGIVQGAIATFIDITDRKQAETELKIAAIAFETQEGMLVTDARCNILRVNRAFTRITGYEAEDVIGKNPKLLSSGLHNAAFYAGMWERIRLSGHWGGEIWNRRKNDEIYPEHLTITAVKNVDGSVSNYVATLTDITASKAAEEEIRNLAFYDPLTELPNRRLLLDRLRLALASSSRSGKLGALLFLDLDHFKTLNDSLGHGVGDQLLRCVAVRLSACVREGDTVARFGGDEFVIMLEDLSELPLEAAALTEAIGNKILDSLNQSYLLEMHEYHSTTSIGATLFNSQLCGIDELLKQADIAMYQAKSAGRNTLRFFDKLMQDAITARVSMEGELRLALKNQQFQLYYQIQVDSRHQPLGAEALIRWQHPVQGMVSPAKFIPLAEETGLILPIGQWVLQTACAQLKAWQNNVLTNKLVLSVNVSARQFHQADFKAQVQSAVESNGINPKLLKLELTEGMLLDNIEETIVSMAALKEIGVQFSLDDFGTGYSSLQYLKRLPLDQMKIDQSFVRDVASDESDRVIVRTIIAMARSLNLDVIAEGVETEDQRQLLFNKGCASFQGYLFGKPLPLAEFEEKLQDSNRFFRLAEHA